MLDLRVLMCGNQLDVWISFYVALRFLAVKICRRFFVWSFSVACRDDCRHSDPDVFCACEVDVRLAHAVRCIFKCSSVDVFSKQSSSQAGPAFLNFVVAFGEVL